MTELAPVSTVLKKRGA